MNKIIWFIVLLIIVVGGYFLFVNNNSVTEPVPVINVPILAPVTPASPISTNVITYNDTGFTPATLTVKRGTTVSFQNASISSSWPASAVHPTHTAYPTTGGCLGSTFDACRGFAPGEAWTFRFDFVGTWQYHDHLHPQHHGTIIVSP